MAIINNILQYTFKQKYARIDNFMRHPSATQEETLSSFIKKSADTEFGRSHDYSSIKSISDYQNKVPIQTYEDIKPYVNRLMNGEKNLIWPGKTEWFAKSSGTTADKSKFIPITREALHENHYKVASDLIAIYYRNNPNAALSKGKGLTLGGSHQIDKRSHYCYGDLSAILIENAYLLSNFFRAPAKNIALMHEWEKKVDAITQSTLNKRITSIVGVPSWMLVLLKHILQVTGKKNIHEIWPELELFIHGGVCFDPYRKQFQNLFPNANMHFMETYNASEGFFALQDRLNYNDMLLMLDSGVFFEFIPAERAHDTNPHAIPISDVQPGVNYAIVITTNAGLWRYLIGDTVEFSSVHPHRIKITGRTKLFINAFGEEIIIDNAEKALRLACEKTNAEITEYTAGPIYMNDNKHGAHEWLIEFVKEPNNLEIFIEVLDQALMSLNSDYEAKRYHNITLGRPVVKCISKGTFYKWFEKKGKLGGQNKIPRLYNSRKYVEELESIYNSL